MLNCESPYGFVKVTSLTVFLLFIHSFLFSQTSILRGIVKDELTLKPIQGVNIKVYGTKKGTFSDNKGFFSLSLNKVPVTLVITCVGYESAYYDITNITTIHVEFLLSPKTYNLQEVDISLNKYSFLFKNKDYSVLDYELMNDNILLLIYRYQLKRSELVLLNRSGDTLTTSKLPEVPPTSLFKDIFANIHYFSKANNSYQCFFNEKNKCLEFLYKTTIDSLLTHFKTLIFKMSDRIYFQENLPNKFGTSIGFYAKGIGKQYIKKYLNEKKVSEYRDDEIFYATWNLFYSQSNVIPSSLSIGNTKQNINSLLNTQSNFDPENFDFTTAGRFTGKGFYDKYERRAHQFEFFNMIYPVIKTAENNIAFFDFANDKIELMNENGNVINSVPISFHKDSVSNSNRTNSVKLSDVHWRWGSTILVDDYYLYAYTMFLRNGMVKIQKINLETGKLNKGTILPFPFPEKIEIYKGDAYFLIKGERTNETWKLVKSAL